MLGKILVGLDGSPNSLRALDFALELASLKHDSQLEAVCVVGFSRDLALFAGLSPEQYKIFLQEKASKILLNAENKAKEKGINITTFILEGDAADALSNYARTAGVDHIVIGSRGLSNIKGMMMGSVSHRLLYQAHCPVTVVR